MKLIKAWLVLLALALHTTAGIAQQPDLLPPEQAFQLQGRLQGQTLVAEFTIAPGYYMYRDAFQFDLETPGVEFAEPSVPDGKIKQDEFFGEVEIYRDRVAIQLPMEFAGDPPTQVRVKTTGQGCADIGVCYPPLYQTLTLVPGSVALVQPEPYSFNPVAQAANTVDRGVEELQNLFAQVSDKAASMQQQVSAPLQPAETRQPEPASTVQSRDPLALLQALGSDLGLNDDEDEIPEPDKAFVVSAQLDSNNVLQTEIVIYRNTYLYRDKMKVALVDGNGHTLGAVALPQGDEKNDEFFGLMQVFHDFVKIPIPVISDTGASTEFVVSLGYQGCVEDKICYPPMTKYLKVNSADRSVQISSEQPQIVPVSTAVASTATNAQPATTATVGQQPAQPVQSEQDEFFGLLENASMWSIFLFFLAGIGLTFTPCVFPMIPILSGIIAGQGDNLTTRKAFTLSLVYVLAMAFTYAVAGAIVGRFGAEFNIQAWFQDPIILSVFAGIFVLLSLSMFGFYDLQMPSFIQSRLTEFSNRQEGGNLVGVAIMGLLSALIVGPCITAPLVGALLFISQTQDWLLGGMALFALGLGMGVPLLLIGTTAGKFLPRAGTWMDAVKAFFGVGLLAVAIWLLERILPTEITMLLMATLIIVTSVYMGAVTSLGDDASGWRKLWKGLGLVLLAYGLFYLYGVAAGSKDLIQPLKGISGPGVSIAGGSTQSGHVQFKQIKGEAGLNDALAAARGQPVMLDFYADWCISCKEMEKYAFTHPEVLAALENFQSLQTDVTDNDKTDQLFMKSLGIYGPPAILFFDRDGQEIPGSRVVGEMSGEEFAAHIRRHSNQL